MKKSTMALIIIICVVVIAATILTPSITSYFEENGLNSEISAKTFNIDEINEDSLTLKNKNTGYYHFVATSVVGGKKLFFTIQDTVQGSFFTLYRKFEGEEDYTKISSSPTGNLVDNIVFNANEKRFYKVEFSSVDESKNSWKTKSVSFLLYTDAYVVKPMTIPQGGMEMERPSKLVLDGEILTSGLSRTDITVSNLVFSQRTDGSDKILAYAVVANGNADVPISLSVTTTTDDRLIFTLKELDGYSNKLDFATNFRASIFVYLPKKFPIEQIDLICNGKFNPSNLVANTINITPATSVSSNQPITLTARNYCFKNLSILPNENRRYFADKLSILEASGIDGAEIQSVYACLSPTYSPKNDFTFENTSFAFSSSVNIVNFEVDLIKFGTKSTSALELDATIDNLTLSTNGMNMLCNAHRAKVAKLLTANSSMSYFSFGSLSSLVVNSNDTAVTKIDAIDIDEVIATSDTKDEIFLSANDVAKLNFEVANFSMKLNKLGNARINNFENGQISLNNWTNKVEISSSFKFENAFSDLANSDKILNFIPKSGSSTLSISKAN